MKTLKKIIFFISVIFLYLILKEFLSLYFFLHSVNEYLAYLIFLLILLFLIYFAFIPIYKILKIPIHYGPVADKDKIDEIRGKRIDLFKKNKFLQQLGLDLNLLTNKKEDYDQVIEIIDKESYKIRKAYVNKLFYSTSVSQNGFLDAILILSTSVNLVKDIFVLYNGRVKNYELFVIAKKVYYSIVIGGSEGVEYVTNEVFSKFATESLKSIPFIDKIITSLVDGFVNAALLTRVSLITENYCKILYIKSDRDLYPSSKFIASTAKDLTSEILKKANSNLLILAKDKTGEIFKKVFNPVTVVLEKSYSTIKDYTPSPPKIKLGNTIVNFFNKVVKRKI